MTTDQKCLIALAALAALELIGILCVMGLCASAALADQLWKKDARARLKKQMDAKLLQQWTEPTTPAKPRAGRWI